MKDVELRRLECMTRDNISILMLLMIIDVRESAVHTVNISDLAVTDCKDTTTIKRSKLGQTLKALIISRRVRITITELA